MHTHMYQKKSCVKDWWAVLKNYKEVRLPKYWPHLVYYIDPPKEERKGNFSMHLRLEKNIRKLYHIVIDKSSPHWEQPLEYSSMLYCLSSKYLLKNTCRIQGQVKGKESQEFYCT